MCHTCLSNIVKLIKFKTQEKMLYYILIFFLLSPIISQTLMYAGVRNLSLFPFPVSLARNCNGLFLHLDKMFNLL